jgi:hypothetical protein
MKEVPKKDEEEVGGGGIVYEPWRPPPETYPPMPGCPTDPPVPAPGDPVIAG